MHYLGFKYSIYFIEDVDIKENKNTVMETNQIMLMEKLEVSGILREALRIPYKKPKFVIFAFLSSLRCTSLWYSTGDILQTVIEAKSFLEQPSFGLISESLTPIRISSITFTDSTMRHIQSMSYPNRSLKFIQDITPNILRIALIYLVPLYLLDLFNTISIVDSSSALYAGEKSLGIKDMFFRSFNKTRIIGPFVTSLYVLPMNLLTISGLTWALSVKSICPGFFGFSNFAFGIVLLVKFLDWTVIWNMGMVISILEERCGIEALGASVYFSRGSRRHGFVLIFIFLVWRYGLRHSCLYVMEHMKWAGIGLLSVLVGMICLGNSVKWIVCMVYFYDCKNHILEKKIDAEDGIQIEAVLTDKS